MVYQSTDYVGMGRMWPFLQTTNEVFAERGITLPASGKAVTTMEDRLEKGAQADIFGPQMKEAWKTATSTAGSLPTVLEITIHGQVLTWPSGR